MADATYADPKAKKADTPDLKALHKTALERFKQADEAYSKQAKRELEDLKFAARKGQWTDSELDARASFQTPNGTLISARPSLVIDKLRQPIQQLENQQRQANLAVDIHPKSGGDQKTADIIQGLYRDIQIESRADQIARFWAYSRALKVGRGVYKVEKVYAPFDPDTDPPEAAFDQEIKISRVLNQAGVLLDPFAQEPDWCDGEWAFEKAWLPQERYKRRRPDAKLAKADESTFDTIGDQEPPWVRKDGDTWSILVVKYWYVKYEKGETVTGPDGQERTLETRKVCVCEMDAHEITDHEEWDGQYIPFIPVVANEENIDGERIWEGLVAPAKDSQRTYNYMTSAFVETVALAPRSPWLVDIDSIKQFQPWWAQSNTRNFPFLPYTSNGEGGKKYTPPQREFGEPPIQALAQGIHQFDANINATTGFFDPSRGNLSQGERSGVALQALQKQSETGNSGYLDNLAQISMTYEGKVILDLIPKVYDRPGRIARIRGTDNQSKSVMLNQPFVKGPDGQPLPAPATAAKEEIEQYDLAKGKYGCAVTIGKSHTTQREESAEQFGQIIQSEPQLLTVLGDLYFGSLDGPLMPVAAERMKKMLPQQLQEQPPGGQPNAQAMQQQLAQMQQALQQLQPLADQNQAKLQQAQMEIASKEKIAQLQEETKRTIAQIQADLDMQTARLKAMTDANVAAGKAQTDLAKVTLQEHSGTVTAAADRAHERLMHVEGQQHDQQLASSDQLHARLMQAEQPRPTNGSGE